MDQPHLPDAVSSAAARTDYGSTARFDDESDITSATTSESTTRGQYQNLAYRSNTSLCRNSPTPRRAQDSRYPSRFFGRMTVDTLPNSETRQIIQRLEFFLNVLNQACIGFVTIYMNWLCLDLGLAGTALHAWLVTIGFSLLMAEGIMCHYSGNVLTFNYKRSTKTTIHWVLQALGGGCGIVGVIFKIAQKGFSLHSTHSKLGFSAFILCLFSMFSGLSALYATRFKRILSPLFNKTLHNLVGLAAFVIALTAQFYGYKTGFFSRKVDPGFQTMIECITLLSLVLTCIGPLKALLHKFKNIYLHFQ